MRPKLTNLAPSPWLEHPALPLFQEPQAYPGPVCDAMHGNASSNSSIHPTANIIKDNNSPCKANLFCFAAFADKHTETLYNNLTGSFPFQSLEGNVCFLVVYHYETKMQSWPSPPAVSAMKSSLRCTSNNMKCSNQRGA